jgi:hypothetical protein
VTDFGLKQERIEEILQGYGIANGQVADADKVRKAIAHVIVENNKAIYESLDEYVARYLAEFAKQGALHSRIK